MPRPLTITRQPENQTAAEGEEVTFTLEAAGEEVNYQWEKGEPPSDADHTFDRNTAGEERFRFSEIPGAEEASYTFTASLEDLFDNVYRCKVTDLNDEQATSRIVWVSEPANLGRSAPGGSITSAMTKTEIENVFGGAGNVSVEMDVEIDEDRYNAKITLLQDIIMTPRQGDPAVVFENGKYVLDVDCYDLSQEESLDPRETLSIEKEAALLLTGSTGGTVTGGIGSLRGAGGINCAGNLTLNGKVTVQGGYGRLANNFGIWLDSYNSEASLLVHKGAGCRVIGRSYNSSLSPSAAIEVYVSSRYTPQIDIKDGYYEGVSGVHLSFENPSYTASVKISGGVFQATGRNSAGLIMGDPFPIPDKLDLSISGGIFCAAEGEDNSKAINLSGKEIAHCLASKTYVQSLNSGDFGKILSELGTATSLDGKMIVRLKDNFNLISKGYYSDGKFFLGLSESGLGSELEYRLKNGETTWEDVQYTDNADGKVCLIPLKALDQAHNNSFTLQIRKTAGTIQGILIPASEITEWQFPRTAPPAVKSVTDASGENTEDGAIAVDGLTDEQAKYQISSDEEIWKDAVVEKGTGDWRITGLAGGKYWLHVYNPNEKLPSMSTTFTVPAASDHNNQGGGNQPEDNTGGDHTGGGNQSGDNPSGGNQPGDNPSGGNQPGDNPSGGNQPSDNPSGGNQPSDNPSGGNQPGDNPSGGNQPDDNPSGGNQPGDNTGNGNQSGNHTGDSNSSGGNPESAASVQPIVTETHTTATENGGTLTTYTAVNHQTGAMVTVQVTRDTAGNVTLVQGDMRDQAPQVVRQGENTTISVKADEALIKAMEAAVGIPLNFNAALPETDLARLLQVPETGNLAVEITAPSALLGTSGAGSRLTGIILTRETLEAVKVSGKSLTLRIKDETGAVRYEWTLTDEELIKALQNGNDLTLRLPWAPAGTESPAVPPALPAQAEAQGRGHSHTVRRGDTVYKIAKQYGCSVEDILNLNSIPNVYDLRIGQEVVIP